MHAMTLATDLVLPAMTTAEAIDRAEPIASVDRLLFMAVVTTLLGAAVPIAVWGVRAWFASQPRRRHSSRYVGGGR